METAYCHGFLTCSAKERALLLVEEGLHPEQVLLGTGLLTSSQYSEVVKTCFGVSLEPLDIALFRLDETVSKTTTGTYIVDESGVRACCVADVWSVPKATYEARPLPVLRSDILRFLRKKEP